MCVLQFRFNFRDSLTFSNNVIIKHSRHKFFALVLFYAWLYSAPLSPWKCEPLKTDLQYKRV